VTVNGKRWTDFDHVKEWVRISNPAKNHIEVIARY